MQIVKCHLEKCLYNVDGWCQKTLVVLDKNGMCKNIWINGTVRSDAFNKNEIFIEKGNELPPIVEGEFENVRTREDANGEYVKCDEVVDNNSTIDECNDDSNDGKDEGIGTTDEEDGTIEVES